MPKKGQTSLEQLIITGIGLTFIALIFYLSINMANDNVRVSQAKDSVDKLAKSADYVYSLGPGSKDTVRVTLPQGMRFLNTSDNHIHMRVSLSSGDADVFANTKGALIGSIPQFSSQQDVAVIATADGKIQFGNDLLTCFPSSITQSIAQGGSNSSTVTVANVYGSQITNISATISTISDITTVTQPASILNASGTTSAGLSFSVPLSKAVGTYSGVLTVNGSNSSQCITTVTIFVTRLGGADTQGPLVTSITTSPAHPHASSTITINAVGDDTTTGNSSIALCQVQVDNSGIWNDMSASDGSYSSPVENVSFTFGTLSQGAHTAYVRCIDSAGNIGSQATHTIAAVKKEILIITASAAPNSAEQKWIDWIDTHSSGAGFTWDYDQVGGAGIGTTTNVTDYGIVVMPSAPNSDTNLYSNLNSYKATNYIVLTSTAIKFGISNLNVGSGNGVQNTRSALHVQASHYVTTGFTVGTNVTISTSSQSIDYHTSFTGTNVLTVDNDLTGGTVIDGGNVITYGANEPASFNSNGNLIATRILDYALSN